MNKVNKCLYRWKALQMELITQSYTYLHPTSPAKKQQCFRSMCFPNDICSNVRRMWSVSIISDSQANGWFLRADSRRGIFALMPWNLCNICVCNRWNVEFNIALHTWSNWRHTWNIQYINIRLINPNCTDIHYLVRYNC